MSEEELKPYVCYYELHVADTTFYLKTVVRGTSPNDALRRMGRQQHRDGYSVQPKGVYGLLEDVLKDPHLFRMMFQVGGGMPEPEL